MIRGRAIESRVELREHALIDLQPGDGDVGMRSALAAPVEVDIGDQLLDAEGIDLDAITLQLEEEGVTKFAASYASVVAGIDAKTGALASR